MMRRFLRSALVIWGLYQIGHLTFELAGEPSISPCIDVYQLRAAFGSALPEEFYWVFKQAYHYQQAAQFEKARFLYSKLLESIQQHAPILLERAKPFLNHNMSLLP